MTQPKMKKRILVGGGAGYIGSMLVPALMEQGFEVEVIDLLWFGNHLPKEIKVKQKDLFDCAEEDFAGFDEFIFLAGLSNDPMAEHSPSKNFIMNGALPSYLAYLCKRAGVRRFIYASSASVYGFAANSLFTEEDKTVSSYPYGISKLQGEMGVMQLADENFSVIILRQGTVSGFSPRMRMDLIINAMFKSAVIEGKITVNNPAIWRPIYDIHDCVNAYFYALRAPISLSGIFNVAANNYTVLEAARQVKEAFKALANKDVPLVIKHLPDMRNYRLSFEKAKAHLGFIASRSIGDIVQSLWEHLDDLQDLNQDAYYNIRVFQEIARREEILHKKLDEIDKFKY